VDDAACGGTCRGFASPRTGWGCSRSVPARRSLNACVQELEAVVAELDAADDAALEAYLREIEADLEGRERALDAVLRELEGLRALIGSAR